MNTKTITALLATTIVLAVFLIGLPSRKPEMPVELPVATPSPIESPQPNPQSRRQEIAAQDSLDSIRLADVLIEARKIAGEHAAEGDFEVSYTVGHEEEGEIIVEINSAHLFSSQFRHLILSLEMNSKCKTLNGWIKSNFQFPNSFLNFERRQSAV
jgi:hypothetical protein